MLIHIDKSNTPLGGTTEALMERAQTEFINNLSTLGVDLTGGDGGSVVFANLKNLSVRNGSLQAGQQALMQALSELRAVRVDTEPMDCNYILGPGIPGHSIARALEAGIEPVCRMLQVIAPDELFDGFDRAWTYICNDRTVLQHGADGSVDPNAAWLEEQLRAGAERDLRAHGLLDGPADVSSWMEPKVDPLTVGIEEYARSRQDIAPFRSSWDQDE